MSFIYTHTHMCEGECKEDYNFKSYTSVIFKSFLKRILSLKKLSYQRN